MPNVENTKHVENGVVTLNPVGSVQSGQDVGNTEASNNQTGQEQSGGNGGSLSEGLGFDTGSVGLKDDADRTSGLK